MNRLHKLNYGYKHAVRYGLKVVPSTLRTLAKRKLPILSKLIYHPVFSPLILLFVLYATFLKSKSKINHPIKVLRAAEKESSIFILNGDYAESIRIYSHALSKLENDKCKNSSAVSKAEVIWLIKNKIKELKEELD